MPFPVFGNQRAVVRSTHRMQAHAMTLGVHAIGVRTIVNVKARSYGHGIEREGENRGKHDSVDRCWLTGGFVTQIMDVVTSELFFFGFLRFHRGEERGGGVVTGHNARA